MVRLLKEANTGTHLHIAAFDYMAYREAAQQRVLERERAQEELRRVRAEEEKDLQVRLASMVALTRDVTWHRLKYANEFKQYATSEWVMHELEQNGEHCGWQRRAKNSDVPIYLGEVKACWEQGIDYPSGMPNSFIDLSNYSGTKLLWEHVPDLPPLDQEVDEQGRVRLRVNSKSVRKLHRANGCLLEAVMFATGETSLAALNMTGFSGAKYEDGIRVHDINVRMMKTKSPYSLYGWQSLTKKRKGQKRGAGGKERRTPIRLFEIISIADAIVVAEAVVRAADGSVDSKHAVVWDGWRRLFFVGPGAYDDRGLDGTLQLDEADVVNESHMDMQYGMTVTDYVRINFKISDFTDAAVVMVRKSRAAETHHV